MRPRVSLWQRFRTVWLGFWFGLPAPHAQLALVRVGTGLILLYVLFVRSFDLAARFSASQLADSGALQALDPIRWPFSVFTWVDGAVWLWSLHVVAVLVAAAFMLGVLTPLMAALSLAFQLSYAHHNPAMLAGVDGLLMLALFYLAIAPSGQVLSVARRPRPPGPPMRFSFEPGHVWEPEDTTSAWSTFPVRLLQLHLCVVYLHSGMARLTGDWLYGVALWHPRLVELGAPFSLETIFALPWLTGVITFGLVLFELFYPLLVWLPRLRYPLLGLALLVHLAVGIGWDTLSFNLLMIVLNLVFVPRQHLEVLLDRLRPMLVLPWLTND